VPGWCPRAGVRVNGCEADASAGPDGYLRLERAWQAGDVVELDLPMAPRLVEAHPWVEATRGRVAIERGPLVYCVEEADHPGARIADLELDAGAPLVARWDGDLLEGVTVVRAGGFLADATAWTGHLYRRFRSEGERPGRPAELIAVPYGVWANRGPGAMRVWIPRRG